MPDWNAYAEAYKRGILPEDKKALYEEAVKRGLTGTALPEPVQPPAPVPTETTPEPEVPQWGRDHPNWYGTYGAGKELINKAVKPTLETVGAIGGSLGSPIVGTALGYGAGKKAGEFLETQYGKLENPEIKTKSLGQEMIESAEDVGGAMLLGKGMDTAGKLIFKTEEIPGQLTRAGKLVMDTIKPKPSPEKALKQVLQGKTKDFMKGKEALSAIHTEGVKTYSDLGQRINSKIKDYAKLVDSELSMDSTRYPLSGLVTKTKVSGGEVVTQNHVTDALSNLQEMYVKINDPVKAKQMEQLLTYAENNGLTKKQVNDLARTYGNEFGEKAFSPKSGEPLTSINGRAYENTRKGLKEIVREGMGPEAKELDSTLSSLINTRRLIEKNIEAVNKLEQRVDPRSLGEKVGRAMGYALDWTSGGTIKGLVGKFLPRGVGNKMLNALDLEEKLSRNLEILREAEKTISKTSKAEPVLREPVELLGEGAIRVNPPLMLKQPGQPQLMAPESRLLLPEGPIRLPGRRIYPWEKEQWDQR